MRPHIKTKILRNVISAAVGVLAISSLYMSAVQAQSIDDPVPIQGNNVTEAARSAANAAAFGGSSEKITEKDMAQKNVVRNLIPQYTRCKSDARARARSNGNANRQVYKAVENACTRQYEPAFNKACVGAANSIAICQRLHSKGTIAN